MFIYRGYISFFMFMGKWDQGTMGIFTSFTTVAFIDIHIS